MKPLLTLFFIALLSLSNSTNAADFLDIPSCHALTAADGKYRLGLTMPLKNPDLAARAYELSLFYQDLSLCQTSWNDILPQWQPQSPVANLERYYGYAIYAISLIISLLLFVLLPSDWRRQVTVLGLFFIAFTTYLFSSAGLWLSKQSSLPQNMLYQEVVLLQKSGESEQWLDIAGVWQLDEHLINLGLKPDFTDTQLSIAENFPSIIIIRDMTTGNVTDTYSRDQLSLEATGNTQLSDAGLLLEFIQLDESSLTSIKIWVAAQDLILQPEINNPQGQQFKVYNSLNIRQQPGVQSDKLKNSPLHKGTIVEVIAPPQGDWWKVRVVSTNIQGWVNSLWLRKIDNQHE